MKCSTFEEIPQAITELNEKLNCIQTLLLKQADSNVSKADELLTVTQAAQFLALATPTIYGLVQRREVPFSKRGKRLYFSKRELIEWVGKGRKYTQSEIDENAVKFLNNVRGGRHGE